MDDCRERLRRYREHIGASKVELAARIGCTASMLGHIESGRRRPGRVIGYAIQEITRDTPFAVMVLDWDNDQLMEVG